MRRFCAPDDIRQIDIIFNQKHQIESFVRLWNVSLFLEYLGVTTLMCHTIFQRKFDGWFAFMMEARHSL